MKNILKKLEDFVDNYLDDLEKKPVKTILKTLIVVWLASKVIKLVKK